MYTRLTFLMLSFWIFASAFLSHILPYADNSLSTSEYLEMGIPSIDKQWTATELNETLQLLKELKEEDKLALPRKNSPYSNEVFTHLSSIDNFNILRDKNVDISERMTEAYLLLHLSNSIIDLYQESHEPNERFGKEVLTLMELKAYLALHRRWLFIDAYDFFTQQELAEQAFRKKHKDAVQSLGEQFKRGLTLVQKKHARFAEDDVLHFMAIWQNLIPESWDLVGQNDQVFIKLIVENMKKEHPNATIRKEAKTLHKKIRKL